MNCAASFGRRACVTRNIRIMCVWVGLGDGWTEEVRASGGFLGGSLVRNQRSY